MNESKWPLTLYECVVCDYTTAANPSPWRNQCVRCLGFGTLVPVQVVPVEVEAKR